jgi:hypothetical protein
MIINNTLKYLLPLVATGPASIYITPETIGAFISDIDNPSTDANIIIVFKLNKDIILLDEILSNNPFFVQKYNPTEKLIAYVYSIKHVEEDYNNVLAGLYSKLSVDAKEKLISFYDLNEKELNFGKKIFSEENKILRVFSGLQDDPSAVLNILQEIFNKEMI